MKKQKLIITILLSAFSFAASAQENLRDAVNALYTKTMSSHNKKVMTVDQLNSFLLAEDEKGHFLQGYSEKDRQQIAYELALMYYDDNAASSMTSIVYPYFIGKIDASNLNRYVQNVKNIDVVGELVERYMNTYERENNRYTDCVFEVMTDGGTPKDLVYQAPESYIKKIETFVTHACQGYKDGYESARNDYSVDKVGQDQHLFMERALQYMERNDRIRLTNYYYKIWPDEECLDDMILATETGMHIANTAVIQNIQKINADFNSKFLYWSLAEGRIAQAAKKAQTTPSKKLAKQAKSNNGLNGTISIMAPKTAEELKEEEGIEIADVQPEYPGGINELMQFLRQSLKYPAIAQEHGVESRIIIQFVVDKEGSISPNEMNILQTGTSTLEYADMLESMSGNQKTTERVHALRKAVNALENEAIRVIKIMPKWKPGYKNGKAVRVKFALPITFRLQ